MLNRAPPPPACTFGDMAGPGGDSEYAFGSVVVTYVVVVVVMTSGDGERVVVVVVSGKDKSSRHFSSLP
jgi:hypothetical protein